MNGNKNGRCFWAMKGRLIMDGLQSRNRKQIFWKILIAMSREIMRFRINGGAWIFQVLNAAVT